MKIRRSKYTFDISEDDILSIRQALKNWGKSEGIINAFNELKLQEYYEAWETFVNTDWDNWDVSEYDHDIGCRYFIQIVIENSSTKTKKFLEEMIKPIDNVFKMNMRPVLRNNYCNRSVVG
ncbi:MAG: hypothetical protein IPJ90_20680 [Anaerolineaceae bacterium]|nr:hypothetical protein [Anaerolineaceae bacterium]